MKDLDSLEAPLKTPHLAQPWSTRSPHAAAAGEAVEAVIGHPESALPGAACPVMPPQTPPKWWLHSGSPA